MGGGCNIGGGLCCYTNLFQINGNVEMEIDYVQYKLCMWVSGPCSS